MLSQFLVAVLEIEQDAKFTWGIETIISDPNAREGYLLRDAFQ